MTNTQHGYGSYNPQKLQFTLHFWNGSGRWIYQELPIRPIRFNVLGQPFGKARWRPHLIQHYDVLPEQGKKDRILMLSAIQKAISNITESKCMTITLDLLDYTPQGEEF